MINAERLARRWLLAAMGYFLLSVCLGVYMGASGDHALYTIHSHVSLLGWVSMGLTAVVYRSFPAAAKSSLATWHFVLYQLALPAMLFAVAAAHSGNKGAEPIAGVASVAVLVSAMVFCWLVFSAREDDSSS